VSVQSVSPDQGSPARESLLVRLRTITRAAHQSLETQIGIVSAITDLTAYRQLLERLLGFFQPLERRLCAVPALRAVVSDLDSRMRGSLLEADLAELGLSNFELRELPRCSDLPSSVGVGRALGSLYVLEGSTLGGQVIAREIAARSAPAARACRFFRSDGDDVGARWKQFATAMERYADDRPSEAAVICESALQTFERLGAWMDRSRQEGPAGA
jgi:heme oxygenase